MKKTLAVIFAAFMVMIASGAFAAEVKMGIVDLTKLVSESQEGKKANSELEAFAKSKQAAAEQLKTKIAALQAEIEKTKDAAGRKTKEVELGKLKSEQQTLLATAQTEIQRKASELRVEILKDVKKAIEAVGEEEKLTVVFTSEYVPYSDKSVDITDKVAKKYEQLKTPK